MLATPGRFQSLWQWSWEVGERTGVDVGIGAVGHKAGACIAKGAHRAQGDRQADVRAQCVGRVAGDVTYNLTVEASEPDEVTAMHLVPVDVGLRPEAVNMATLLSSSLE